MLQIVKKIDINRKFLINHMTEKNNNSFWQIYFHQTIFINVKKTLFENRYENVLWFLYFCIFIQISVFQKNILTNAKVDK